MAGGGEKLRFGDIGALRLRLGESEPRLGILAHGDVGDDASQPNRTAFAVIDRAPVCGYPVNALVAPTNARFERQVAGLRAACEGSFEGRYVFRKHMRRCDFDRPLWLQLRVTEDLIVAQRPCGFTCGEVDVPAAQICSFKGETQPLLILEQRLFGPHQRTFRLLALGDVDDKGDAVETRLVEHGASDQNGKARAILANIFLFERRGIEAGRQKLRDGALVEIGEFRRGHVAPFDPAGREVARS